MKPFIQIMLLFSMLYCIGNSGSLGAAVVPAIGFAVVGQMTEEKL